MHRIIYCHLDYEDVSEFAITKVVISLQLL